MAKDMTVGQRAQSPDSRYLSTNTTIFQGHQGVVLNTFEGAAFNKNHDVIDNDIVAKASYIHMPASHDECTSSKSHHQI